MSERAAIEARKEEREKGRKRVKGERAKAKAREEKAAVKAKAANYRNLKHRLRAESAAARSGVTLGRELGLAKGLAKAAERIENFRIRAAEKKADIEALRKDFRDYMRLMGYSSKKLRDRLPVAALREDFTTPRRMIQLLDEVAKIVRQVQTENAQELLRKALKRLDLAKMRPEYKEDMQAVLDAAGISIREYAAGEDKRLRAIQEYVAADRTRTEEIPNSLMQKVALLRGKKISDLSLEDAQEIREGLLHLHHLNNVKNKLLGRGKRRDYLKSREGIVAELDKALKEAPRE